MNITFSANRDADTGLVTLTVLGIDTDYCQKIRDELELTYTTADKNYTLMVHTAGTNAIEGHYGAQSDIYIDPDNPPTAQTPLVSEIGNYGNEDFSIFEGRVNSVFGMANG